VYERLTARAVEAPSYVDLRELLARQAAELGVRHVSLSQWCTRCHNERFFSHRCGDQGRQLAVIVATTLSDFGFAIPIPPIDSPPARI
jgi:hypothetical protein